MGTGKCGPIHRATALLLAVLMWMGSMPLLRSDAAALGTSLPAGLSAPGISSRSAGGVGYFGSQLGPVELGFYLALLSLHDTPPSINFYHTMDPQMILPLDLTGVSPTQYNNEVNHVVDEHLLPVLEGFMRDHPDLYWVTSSGFEVTAYTLVQDGVVVESLHMVSSIFGASQLSLKRAALRTAVDTIVQGAPAGSPYEQVLWLHQQLLETASPIPATAYYTNAVGALVDGAANSWGYARAFQLLCNELDIPCAIGSDGANMWNYVQLDGQWYGVDAHWNDQNNRNGYLLAGSSTLPTGGGQAFGSAHQPSGLACPTLAQDAYQETPDPTQPAALFPVNVAAATSLTYGQGLEELAWAGHFETDDGVTVEGTLLWVVPEAPLTVGLHPIGYEFYPDDEALYAPYLEDDAAVTLEVTRATVAIHPVSGSSQYAGAALPEIAYTCSGLVLGDTRESVFGDRRPGLEDTGVGLQAVTLGALAQPVDNYTVELSPATWRIEKRSVWIQDISFPPKYYDDTTAVASPVASLGGVLPGESVALPVTAAFDTEWAGGGKTVTATPDAGGITGPQRDNYVFQGGSFQKGGQEIHKYGAPVYTPATVTVSQGEYSFNSLALEPMLIGPPGWAGDCQFTLIEYAPVSGFFVGMDIPAQPGNLLYFSTEDTLLPGQTATITVEVRCQNYETALLVIPLEVSMKSAVWAHQPPTGLVEGKEYDGQAIVPTLLPAQAAERITWARSSGMVIPELGVRYRYLQDGSVLDTPPSRAGDYALVVSVDDAIYEGSFQVPFSIHPRPVTLRPADKEMLAGDPEPVYEFTQRGLLPGETLEGIDPVPQMVANVDINVPGSYDIAFTGQYTLPNYAVRQEIGVLTVKPPRLDNTYLSAPPSSGGWHREPIQVVPTGKNGFDKISLTGEVGTFGSSILLEKEGEGRVVPLYLAKGSLVVSVEYRYSLDTTPPVIEFTHYTQNRGQPSGSLTVRTGDSLSGVDTVRLTDPAGTSVQLAGDAFPVDLDGVYTITVTDKAGNSARDTVNVTIRRINAVTIANSNGTPLSVLDGVRTNNSGSYQLLALVTGSALAEDYDVTWTTDAPQVAQVDGIGVLTLRSEGMVTITAQAMDKFATATLTVIPQPTGGSSSSAASGPDSASSTVSSAERKYWDSVLARIWSASDGATVRISTNKYLDIPAGILDAIFGRDISLTVSRSIEGSVTVNGLELPDLDGGKDYYSFADLRAMAGDIARRKSWDKGDSSSQAESSQASAAQAAPTETKPKMLAATVLNTAGGQLKQEPEPVTAAAPVPPRQVQVSPAASVQPPDSVVFPPDASSRNKTGLTTTLLALGAVAMVVLVLITLLRGSDEQ